ncbi:MAG TPA: TonB-dependent receptor [Steroidobacteraceae bacterium]|nr:TonB-dependent receptor [Steroidobacteraceae bacterium]
MDRQRNRYSKEYLAAAVSALGLGIWTPVLAEVETSSQPVALQEVIVTAQKRSENIDKVPMSIQAYSSETLQRAGVDDPSGLARLTPGLTFARSSANTPIYTLRGIGFNTPNLSSTSPVGIYVDEVAYAYPYMSNGPLFDVERVEVLKGPQGTLYGRNTTGGLVNFITAPPENRFEASATAEFGNYKTRNFEGFVNAPVSDTLAIRLAGRSEISDEGWQKSVTRDDRLGKVDRLGVRAEARWTPTDALKVGVTASYWRDRSDTVATQAIVYRPEQPAFAYPGLAQAVRTHWSNTEADWDPGNPRPKTDSDFYSMTGRIDYKFNEVYSFVSLTGYNHVNRNDYNDQDGTPYPVFGFRSLGHIGSFSQELRWLGDFDRFSFIGGAYYSVDRITDDQIGTYSGSSTGALLRYVAQNLIDPTNQLYSAQQYANGFANYGNELTEKDQSGSIFGNVDWTLSDQLKLSGGLRYTRDDLQNGACSSDYNGVTLPIWNTSVHFIAGGVPGGPPLVVPNGCLTYSADFKTIAGFDKPSLVQSNVAGRLSAQYTFDNDVLAYATFSRGYKSGAVPVLPAFSETQYTPARQESVSTFELGGKSSFFDHRLKATLAGFYYDYTDKQLFSEVPDVVFTALKRIVNVPKSKVYGAEFDIAWQLTNDLQLHSGASYTKSEITNFIGYDTLGHPQDFAGSPFPYTPKWQGIAGGSYETPITTRVGLSASLDASYQSSTSTALGNETGLYLKQYTVVNATLGVYQPDKRWRVELYAKNLFDENYWTTADVATDTAYRIPGMPRTFGIRMNVRTN